jgi:hypothetical protein
MEGKYERLQSGLLVYGTRFESGTFLMRSSVNRHFTYREPSVKSKIYRWRGGSENTMRRIIGGKDHGHKYSKIMWRKIKKIAYFCTVSNLETQTPKKSEICPTTRHGGAWRERRYSSYSFYTSALDRVEWSASRHGRALAPG